ncbi:helix-turn-helix domain-containing protein [Gorillibacterium sp. sgz5001074]|uniref:helix-turn-helix domain-containing protein n=1 Tax=Gorillibacterium sp. sgz5001074 TaxID=3446695 RepID=UPI003F66CA12
MLRFTAPPLPYYIMNGFASMPVGTKHVGRRSIGVFDLLVVTKGCLYIAEEDRRYELAQGQALVLRPDCHHYPVRGCTEETDSFWLHFHTDGPWWADYSEGGEPLMPEPLPPVRCRGFNPQPFTISIPQYATLREPELLYRDLERLIQLEASVLPSGDGGVIWEQQQLFQRVLKQLSASAEPEATSPAKLCAQRAASYLRSHYKDEITAKELGEQLNFHPVYIARCMQKEFGVSPFEYLNRFRIEQAKLLMVQTDLSIARIAEEVGFQQAAYFSTCFTRYEGVPPRNYRNRFS